jgi:hypothetical protein
VVTLCHLDRHRPRLSLTHRLPDFLPHHRKDVICNLLDGFVLGQKSKLVLRADIWRSEKLVEHLFCLINLFVWIRGYWFLSFDSLIRSCVKAEKLIGVFFVARLGAYVLTKTRIYEDLVGCITFLASLSDFFKSMSLNSHLHRLSFL